MRQTIIWTNDGMYICVTLINGFLSCIFARCLKPNNEQKARTYDSAEISRQLRYSGVLQITEVRSLGYPIAVNFSTFKDRYEKCGFAWEKQAFGALVNIFLDTLLYIMISHFMQVGQHRISRRGWGLGWGGEWLGRVYFLKFEIAPNKMWIKKIDHGKKTGLSSALL